MSAHSFLPPSGASTWSRCALWPTMNERYPQDDTAESAEGTAAHWVATEMHAGRTHTEGTAAPNSVIVTGEMLDGAELVCETLERRHTLGLRGPIPYQVEQRVHIGLLHPKCFGTPDYWAYEPRRYHIEIVDYKFGHGFVDEFFNLQGLLYALGVVELVGCQDVEFTVGFTVVQPRCYYRGEPVRTHIYRRGEMWEHVERLRAAAQASLEPRPAATTNDECEHCPGRHACSALQMAAYRAAEVSNNRLPHDLTPEAASLELRMLERGLARLQARVDGLQELTLANLKAGKRVPHYRAEPGKGRAQWTVAPERVISIGKLLGKELSKPGVLTPAQAQKKGVDESVISAYSAITPGAMKLVVENNSDAQRVFGSPEIR